MRRYARADGAALVARARRSRRSVWLGAERSARVGAPRRRHAAVMNPRSEAVELEVLGGEGEPRAAPRPLRLSLLELIGKLVRRDQPAAVNRRARHNHRFRTFVACGQSPSLASTTGLGDVSVRLAIASRRCITMQCLRGANGRDGAISSTSVSGVVAVCVIHIRA